MHPYEQLLQDNKDWAAGIVAKDPLFFKSLSELQTPEFLWIGCSDSRVPGKITNDRIYTAGFTDLTMA